MTDKEKIRTVIGRIQDSTMDANHNFTSSYNQGMYDALTQIDAFLDRLPEEPANEEMEEYAESIWPDCDMYVNHDDGTTQDVYPRSALLYMFEQGALWQKQQMTNSAVSAEVNYWNLRGLSIRLEDIEVEDLAGEGDKVKLIIIKED